MSATAAVVMGIISLVAAGAQGGMQASSRKKAAGRAEEIQDEQDRQVDEQRNFDMKMAKEGLSRAEDEFAHTKKMQTAANQFTKMDLANQKKQFEDTKRQGITQNVLSFGTGERLRQKDRSRFRLEAM